MKILITGSKGQLGNELQDIISKGYAEIGQVSHAVKNSQVIALDVDKLDITKLTEVKEVLIDLKPDAVINCAAATNVDRCEINEDFAFKVNSIGPRNLAIVCEEIGAKLVQVSTDYVFSGVGEKPLTEYDLTDPYSVYGKTILLDENYVREFCSKCNIIRTVWLDGYVDYNFGYIMRRVGKERDGIKKKN